MKKWLIIPVLVFVIMCTGTFLTTSHLRWERIGTINGAAANADAALGVAERDYTGASVLANSVVYKLLRETNGIEVRFVLTTNNADVDIDVWAARDVDEMARVCTLDVVCGQQDAVGDTYHYADTINITNNKWLNPVKAVVPGTDHQARWVFDAYGYTKILFHGYGTFDEDCIIEVTGF